MSHVVGGHHVLPLDLFGALETLALGIIAGLEIATRKIDALLVVVFATAIERFLQIAVIHAPQLLARIAVVVVLWGGLGIDFRKSNGKTRRQEQWKCR